MSQGRKQTRDLLLEYDFTCIHPRAGGLSMIYPWENNELLRLKKQIFQIAVDSGFNGSEHDFWEIFGNGQIIVGNSPSDFPIPGKEEDLYYDRSSGTVYYFKEMATAIIENDLPTGAIIAGTSGDISYLYVPIRAMLLENIIISGGDV